MDIINKSKITEIGHKNIKLYSDACSKINRKNGINAIFADLSIQDLYLTLDENKFNTIYPYDQKWLNFNGIN